MLTVRDIMTTAVTTFSPETTIREAIEVLTEQHLSGAPAVSGNKVVGVVSITDLLAFIVNAPQEQLASEDESVAEAWEDSPSYDGELEDAMQYPVSDAIVDESTPYTSSLLDQHTVEEAMTAHVISVKPDASLKTAATLMRNCNVHRLIVMEGKHLKGILSALDIAKAVSEKGIGGQTGVTLDACVPNPSPWIDI